MIPTFISNAEGSAVNKAISGVIVGGQTLSLLLTLLATPVAYSLFDDLSVMISRLFHRQAYEESQRIERDKHRESLPGGNGDTLMVYSDHETVVIRREPAHETTAEDPAFI
jgi:HAE1 family hydrophobic/amphiphilic exporter-1